MFSAQLALQLLHSILLFPVFLLIITVASFAQGLAALWCGDHTAQRAGLLTLNPAMHIDLVKVILSMLVLTALQATLSFPPFFSFFACIIIIRMYFYEIPVDRSFFFHSPKSLAIIAAAGPASMFLMHLLGLYGTRIALLSSIPINLSKILLIFFGKLTNFSLWLGWLRLLPLTGFHSSDILHYLVPSSRAITEQIEPYALPIFFAIIFLAPLQMIFIEIPCILIHNFLSLFVFI